MSIIAKALRKLGYCILTALAKIRLGNNLSAKGILRVVPSTQIIIENGKINLGKDVLFQRNVSISAVSGGVLSIGDNVSFNRNCIIVCRDKISIDNNVIFGPGVTIYDHDHKFSSEGILPDYKKGPVVIEEGCWISANVTILRNTHIGKGSVIGAGAIVKGVIPAHSLVKSNRELISIPIKEK